MEEKHLLVVSSHALDYLWRAGGTIHHYVKKGWKVCIVALTFGERGESDALWKKMDEPTEEAIKAHRKKDAMIAAEILGVEDIRFFDWSDYPLIIDKERLMQLALAIKEFQPDIILTQFKCDHINFDHVDTAEAVFKAARYAAVEGVYPHLKKIAPPEIYMYEPSQPEFFGFDPNIYIDITDEMEAKVHAMQEAASAQPTIPEAYCNKAINRARNARFFSGKEKIKYAEAFVQFAPIVRSEF